MKTQKRKHHFPRQFEVRNNLKFEDKNYSRFQIRWLTNFLKCHLAYVVVNVYHLPYKRIQKVSGKSRKLKAALDPWKQLSAKELSRQQRYRVISLQWSFQKTAPNSPHPSVDWPGLTSDCLGLKTIFFTVTWLVLDTPACTLITV